MLSARALQIQVFQKKLYSFKTNLYRTFWPSWSDDGEYLAFEGNDESATSSNSIWVIEFPQDLE